MDFSIFQQLGIALALGLLIGLEREHRYQVGNYDEFGGIRTFALIGLTGALAYMLRTYDPAFFAVITAGFLALLVAAYVITAKEGDHKGATSEIASILVYIVGVLSAMEMYLIAVSLTLVMLLILHFKGRLHAWAKNIKSSELISTIQFIIIAFVVLPLLPNQSFGPYGFFNPYLVWLMVVFISGISFVSYIAMRLFGTRKGIFLTGFFAGFISSTALAFSFSEQSKKNKKIVTPYVLAVVIASSAMFFRVLIEIAVINQNLLEFLIIPLLTMGIVGLLAAAFLWFKSEPAPKDIKQDIQAMESPFSLWPALKFGLLFAVVLLLTKFAMAAVGDGGIYFTSLLSAVFDVDAITVSMANLSNDGLAEITATVAITIAAIVNTLSKGFIFLIFGNKKVAVNILATFFVIILAGVISFLFVGFF